MGKPAGPRRTGKGEGEMRTISGIIEFNGEEYDYKAEIGVRGKDYHPDRITDLDCADGTALPDEIDYEALEALAMENAQLLDWCEREGWELEDTGGGCSAFSRTRNGSTQRITKADDPIVPQTMTDPIIVGLYDHSDTSTGEPRHYSGGIDGWIASGGC